MRKSVYFYLITLAGSLNLASCDKTDSPPSPSVENKAEKSVFSAADALENLEFSQRQYLKMLQLIDDKKSIKVSSECPKPDDCQARSLEHDAIFLEKKGKWTNGFYPGVLWHLLSAEEYFSSTSEKDRERLTAAAIHHSNQMLDQAKRTNTHDLGMIIDFSIGLAVANPNLDAALKEQYIAALNKGRESLASRYDESKGVIKSWDWAPGYNTAYIDAEGTKVKKTKFALAKPWSFPVIIDNMMNLEYLLTSDNKEHRRMAYQHAKTTWENHFFYEDSDTQKQRPIAYHLFEYDQKKPGNWQGLGNISAWSRGQGWALYGFAETAAFAKMSTDNFEDLPDFAKIADDVYTTVAHFTREDKVPLWDYFADRENAYSYAKNTSSDTFRYSRILDTCIDQIPEKTLPYRGYRPILFDQSILATDDVEKLKGAMSPYNEPILIDGKIAPCGTKAYDLSGREIPRDTSAAALYAAGLYRLVEISDDPAQAKKYQTLADEIMAELTQVYRTDKNKGSGYELGFVLNNATGNLPNRSEIDTPIVYADYFFIEANIRKLELESGGR